MVPYVRQRCEQELLNDKLLKAIRVPLTEETATRHAIRQSFEREIRSKMNYLDSIISAYVIQHFKTLGILSNYPELQADHYKK